MGKPYKRSATQSARIEQRQAKDVNLFRFAARLVLVANLAFAGLMAFGWIRSFRIADVLLWCKEDITPELILVRRYTAINSHGGLQLNYDAQFIDDSAQIEQHRPNSSFEHTILPDAGYPELPTHSGAPGDISFHFLGLDVSGWRALPPSTRSGQILGLIVTVPYECLAAVFWAYPLVYLSATIALLSSRRHRAKWSCPTCGYDLRASSVRCPECGAAFVRESAGV
jgi:predicted RNA-binding Zn-ribbon protein involved in translation (DUF1610 family)